MFDPQKLLQQVLGGGNAQPPGQTQPGPGLSADTMKGAAIGGLAGLLLGSKTGRSLAGPVLQAGGVAVLGGLAYAAWQNWQAQKAGGAPAAIPAQPDATFLPAPGPERDGLGLTLLSAMIAAAKSDGHIDADEQGRIFARAGEASLSPEEKGFLMDQFARPLGIDALAAKATTPERAAEIYTASRLAIDEDHERETGYLDALARRLGIDPALRRNIDAVVSNAVTPALAVPAPLQ